MKCLNIPCSCVLVRFCLFGGDCTLSCVVVCGLEMAVLFVVVVCVARGIGDSWPV